ncbi:relaxase/mobilization nuclease domain-containing protein [Ochrobactrum sp. LMG 5442]|nr:relaxase/mobilization nuclease domain-containing protein [Ochrobactrum sp. LMG 5442]
MMISFFKHGRGGGTAPVEYLIAQEVITRDDNRDIIRDANGSPLRTRRIPLPEVLSGDPERTRQLIDGCRHRWRYTSGVLAFERDDQPDEDQQRRARDEFEALAFAGLEANQRDILWVRHTHEGRVELHFLVPRMELDTGRSFNIAPPGSTDSYDALRDCLNKEHGWADPMDPDRTRDVTPIIEDLRRGAAREKIHDWLLDRIANDEIENRYSMIERLIAEGFDVPRTGKDYLTLRDPETGERFRLRGDIFHENWTRTAAIERALGRKAGNRDQSGSRLARIPLAELQERLCGHIEKRTRYNRARYSRREGDHASRDLRKYRGDHDRPSIDPAHDSVRSLGGNGIPDLPDRNDLRHDLLVGTLDDPGGYDCQLSADRLGNAFHAEWPGDQLGSVETLAERMQQWETDRSMPDHKESGHKVMQIEQPRTEYLAGRDQGSTESGKRSNEYENRGSACCSPATVFAVGAGARIARLRRTVDTSLRSLGSAVRKLGETVDYHHRNSTDSARRWREIADRFADIIGRGIEWLHTSIGRYREHAAEFAREQESVDERRRSVEAQLAEIAQTAAASHLTDKTTEQSIRPLRATSIFHP